VNKNLSRYELVIFDFDGTIIDSKLDIANSVLATLKELNLTPISYDAIYGYVGTGVEPLIRQSVEAAGGNGNMERALSVFRNHYWENLLVHTIPYPGVMEGLEKLDNMPLALLSNKSKRFVDKIVQGLGMERYFSYIFGGDSFSRKKPDPEAIHHMVKKSGVPPSSALMVGDSGVDIKTGKNAGVKTCGVTYGYRDREELKESGADFIMDSFDEVIQIILDEK